MPNQGVRVAARRYRGSGFRCPLSNAPPPPLKATCEKFVSGFFRWSYGKSLFSKSDTESPKTQKYQSTISHRTTRPHRYPMQADHGRQRPTPAMPARRSRTFRPLTSVLAADKFAGIMPDVAATSIALPAGTLECINAL